MPYKNRKYLDWVKEQECVVCYAPADDPHHIIGAKMGGMGMKAPDWAVMPVCRRCHTLLHEKPDMWGKQWGYVAKTLGKAIEQGVLCVN